MDEFFQMEQHIGKVQGLISLQFSEDKLVDDPSTIVYHQFEKPEPVVEQVKKPAEDGEEEEAAEEAPAEEGGDDGKPKWDPQDYTWTVTNRKSKNLAQIFKASRGPKCIHDVRLSKEFGVSRGEQISNSLEPFLKQVM